MIKKCEFCGKEYEAQKEKQKYCCNKCRTAAYRERQQEERKKAIKAYKDRTINPVQKWPAQDPNDKFTKLIQMKATGGLLTAEYWEMYREYSLERDSKRVVNGIPVTAPHFVEGVLVSIEEFGQVKCWIDTGVEESKYEIPNT